MPLALNEPFEFHSDVPDESSSESEIPAQDGEVLEISDALFITEYSSHATDDQVILLPEIETQASLSEKGICLYQADEPQHQIDESQQKAESPMSENGSEQVSRDAEFTCAQPEQGDDSLIAPQLSEAFPVKEVERTNRMRLMGFSTSKQIAVAGACVLFIVLMQVFVTSSSQTSIKAESSAKAVSPAAPEVEHKEIPAPAQVSLNSVPPAPTPTPAAVVEEKPTAAPPSTDQPTEKQKGLYTLQVGSHQDIAEANNQAEKLRAAGFEPRVVSVEIPKRGLWYRVQVGDFSNRDEANRFGATLRAKSLADNFIVSEL